MSHYGGTPARRCAPCDRDWPNVAAYNLCPRCLKCTFAHVVIDAPDYPQAKADADRYKAFREFDAAVDAGQILQVPADWVRSMEDLLALTPSIPDPEPTTQTNYGLAGPNFHGGNPPTDEDADA